MNKYRVECWNSCVDAWVIIDGRGVIVFRGTYTQCEDWLDREENHARRSA